MSLPMSNTTQLGDSVFTPNPTKQTFLLRAWRQTVADTWRYTIVIPNVEKRHHFHSLADATQFIARIIQT